MKKTLTCWAITLLSLCSFNLTEQAHAQDRLNESAIGLNIINFKEKQYTKYEPNLGLGLVPTEHDIEISRDYDSLNADYISQFLGWGNHKKNQLPIPFFNNIINNYPNPFINQTTFQYFLSKQATVSMMIFDNQGRLITTLLDKEEKKAGAYEQMWHTDTLPSGIYYCRWDFGDQSHLQKVIRW